MAELGVPLTRHPGFHQFDVYGNLLGLLAAHPIAPLVTLHHLDVVEAVFPNSRSHSAAIRRLFDGPIRLDSAGVKQQSICYDVKRHWTVSVSWGFVVQVVRGIMSPWEMERPARTFLNWYRRADYTAYSFNTRPGPPSRSRNSDLPLPNALWIQFQRYRSQANGKHLENGNYIHSETTKVDDD